MSSILYRTKYVILLLIISSLLVACSSSGDDGDEDSGTISEVTLAVVEVEEGSPDAICDSATPASEPSTRQFNDPAQVLQDGVDYRAIFCTGVGAIYVDLYEDYTPMTVNNFVFLAQSGYYNNTTFHRVLADFMAQAGDPTGTGSGGPGYTFADEPVGFLNFNRPGLLAMANTGQPVSNGSQFFITTSEPEYLNFRHTIFGEVLAGYDVVENISLRDPASATQPGTSLDTIVIITDPEIVVADVPEVQLATIEDATAILSDLPDIGLSIDEAVTGVFTTESLFDMLSASVENSAEATTVFNDNHHQFSVSISHVNGTCDLESIGVVSIGYTLHTFASVDDANTVIASDIMQDLIGAANADSTVDSDVLPYPVYVENSSECDIQANRAVTYWQRGRSIAVVYVTLPSAEMENVDGWIDQVVGRQIYELLFTDLLSPEIRGN